MLSLIIVTTLFTLIYIWIKKRAKFWTDRGFPSGEFVFPFGSLKDIGTKKSFCEGLDENYRKFKGKALAVGIFQFTTPMLIPIDPELIKTILVTNFENFPDRPIFYNKVKSEENKFNFLDFLKFLDFKKINKFYISWI
jgi:cytochrome P450 family 6